MQFLQPRLGFNVIIQYLLEKEEVQVTLKTTVGFFLCYLRCAAAEPIQRFNMRLSFLGLFKELE